MWCHVGFRRIFRCQSRRVLGDNSTTNGHTIDNDTELELDAVKTDNFALTRKIYVVDGHRPWNLIIYLGRPWLFVWIMGILMGT